MIRDIKYVVVHCTATPINATIDSIKKYWRENLGWKNPGYHFIICRDGTIENIQHENLIANGVKGYNEHSIHLSYIGGIDDKSNPVDNRTAAQKDAMFELIMKLTHRYPNAEVKGHRDFPNVQKACPSFDVKTWLTQHEPSILQAA